jgi:L-lactate utilization protein LutB
MDENVEFILEKRVNDVIENLKKKNMSGYYVKDKPALLKLLDGLISDQRTVSVGGSMTLFESGVIDYLRQRPLNFLDRYEEGLDASHIKALYRASFSADVYLTSSNAITETGGLYNVDGRGNRVAAMMYGPDKVIVIAGVNKIVKDLEAAIERNRKWAAPANAKRLNRQTPCAKVGYCTDCDSPDRICHEFTYITSQMTQDRIHVILTKEDFGY